MFYELRDFIDYLDNDLHKSKNTILAYERDIKTYLLFLEKYRHIKNLEFISKEDILTFVKSLSRKDLSSTTISRKISAIKTFHRFLQEDDICDLNVALDIPLPKKSLKIPHTLSFHEVTLLLESVVPLDKISKRNKAMLELLYSSGLRISELLNLRTKDLHLNDKYLRILGKGDKERLVPIGDIARFALIDYIENARSKFMAKDKSYVFYNYNGDPLSRQAFHKILKELVKSCGITKNVSAHTLRHSFATHMLQNGTDLRVIKDLLGHSNIATTEIYTHLDKENLKTVYNKTYPGIKEDRDV